MDKLSEIMAAKRRVIKPIKKLAELLKNAPRHTDDGPDWATTLLRREKRADQYFQ
ncbi:MAG: hypothetical protein VW576_05115 [Opitutae bacterium]